VKGRTGGGFGTPGESVAGAKMRNIMEAAKAYLFRRRMANRPCRFDVVCVNLDDNRDARFEHIMNALEA
jgi:putative endonuclease